MWVVAVLILAASLVTAGWLLVRVSRSDSVTFHPTRLFDQVVTHIRRFGVDSLPEPELFRRAADGLIRELNDEFAAIRPEGARESAADPGGLGLLVSSRGPRTTVLGVIPDSPAERAGIQPGDQLFQVDERVVEGMGRDAALAALAGPPGSSVPIQIRRPWAGQVMEFTLLRARPAQTWVSPPVDLGDGIWYLGIRLLGPGTTREVRRHLGTAAERGAQDVVLDLRGASGGSLEEGVSVASLFLPDGAPVVVVRGREEDTRRLVARGGSRFSDVGVVVLVDGGTADAAEVVAGALQDNDRALVVGRPTFGRGVTPEEFPIENRMVIRISTARWETPSGRAIQPERPGIPPDSIAGRPGFRTGAGRDVLGGGGIVPDSLVPGVVRGEAQVGLFRALGPSGPQLEAAVRRVAAELAATGGITSPGFRPEPADRFRVQTALREQGVRVNEEVWDAASNYILQELGDRAVLSALGRPGLIRREAARDRALGRAVMLLRSAEGPLALLGLGG